MKKINKGLYFITNSDNYKEEEFLSIVDKVCSRGVSLIQLREKDKKESELLELAWKVKEIADKYDVPLIIDDNVNVAKILGVGVHLGSEDMSISKARAILGDEAIIGATAKTVEVAKKSELESANYLGVGAIYATITRVKTKLTSIQTLKEITEAVTIPVFAIGGLREDNLDVLKDTGIHGICVVSRIMDAAAPEEMTDLIKERLEDIL